MYFNARPGLKPQADSRSPLKPDWSALASPALADFNCQTGNSLLGFNGQRIGIRQNGAFYLLQDHLKSSSSFVNQSGATLTNNYYYPYGGNRGGAFSNLTTKRFTGQYHESSLPGGEGLSYYNARWYDAKLGRFLSADTIVPGPANPQAFNRYSYVFNNPLKYIDPNGHCPSPSVPGGTGAENRAARAESGRCTALVNTILNSWDKTDYWQKRWPDKEAFKKYLGDSPLHGYDFFLPYWMESLAYEKEWNAAHPSTPCTGCSGKVEYDFGEYTAINVAFGYFGGALVIDDFGNVYIRTDNNLIGSPGFGISRGDIFLSNGNGTWTDMDQAGLSREDKTVLAPNVLVGISRGGSIGAKYFAAGVAYNLVGPAHLTVETGVVNSDVTLSYSQASYTFQVYPV